MVTERLVVEESGHERDVANVRRAIKQAGQRVFFTRWLLLGCVALPCLIEYYHTFPLYRGDAIAGMLAWAPRSAAFSVTAAVIYRNIARMGIRRKLSDLPAELRAEALRPLRKAHLSDTRRIVAELGGGLPVPTEVVAAGAPDGRGEEVARGVLAPGPDPGKESHVPDPAQSRDGTPCSTGDRGRGG